MKRNLKDIEENLPEYVKKDAGYHFEGKRHAVDLVIIAGDKLLLIQRLFGPFGYALPGGMVEKGEKPEEAALRELKEETGLQLSKGDLHYIGKFDKEGRDPRGIVVSDAFLVVLDKAPEVKEGDDAGLAKWVSMKEVNRLIENSRVLTNEEKNEKMIKGELTNYDLLAFDHWKIIEKALKILQKVYKSIK